MAAVPAVIKGWLLEVVNVKTNERIYHAMFKTKKEAKQCAKDLVLRSFIDSSFEDVLAAKITKCYSAQLEYYY